MSGLPEGWESPTLDELTEFAIGGDWGKAPDYQGPDFVDAKCIRGTELRSWATEKGATSADRKVKISSLEKRKLKEHDLIVEVSGGGPEQPVGRVARISADVLKGFGNTPAVCTNFFRRVMLSEKELARYIERFLSADYAAGGTVEIQSGSNNIRNLNFNKYLEKTIPLPPLAEQRRIVEKLDQLSARTRAAKDHLARVQTLATRAKQTTLAAAFRGELLGLEVAPTEQFNDRCWDLPAGWSWKRFEDVATIKSNLRPPSEMQDLPHIAPDNIEAGTGRLLPYRTIAEDGVKSGKHHFFPGQIIYSKIRPYLRKAVSVDFEGACSADMYPVECGPDLHKGLLLQWLISEDFAWFTSEHEGRSVLPKINQKALNSTPVPVPPLEEQTEIVRRIEAAFARIDRMVAEATRAAALLERLEAQLLAKAFRGELVPQDPNDEPASALLARIREARANAPKAKRKRGNRGG